MDNKNKTCVVHSTIASIGAAIITKTSTNPFERIKVLQQVRAHYDVKLYNNIFSSNNFYYKAYRFFNRFFNFTITESGTIEDPYIIEGKCRSSNNRDGAYNNCTMFNSSTLRAALKLKYKPTVRDGKTVAVEDVPHKYTFELEI